MVGYGQPSSAIVSGAQYFNDRRGHGVFLFPSSFPSLLPSAIFFSLRGPAGTSRIRTDCHDMRRCDSRLQPPSDERRRDLADPLPFFSFPVFFWSFIAIAARHSS